LSQTAASNYPQGSDSPSTLDEVQRAHGSFIALLRDGKGLSNPTTLASAGTTDIGGQNSLFVEISGTATITSLGTNYNGPRYLRFTGALTLTHNATTLNIPGSASITTTAGDTCVAIPNVALNGWNISNYTRASGIPSGVAVSGAITSSGLTQATNRLLGRTTASTGEVEEISLGATLAMSAGVVGLSGAQTGSAPVFGARAFCTWNGATTGTYAPTLPSGNISSIQRNSAGNYTLTFSTAMADAEYSVAWGGDGVPTMGIAQSLYPAMGVVSKTSAAVTVQFYSYAGSTNIPTGLDVTRGHIAIFR